MTPGRGLVPPVALRPATPAHPAIPVLAPPLGAAPAQPPAGRAATAVADKPGAEDATKRRIAPTVFTVLSLALAPLVAAVAVLLLPAGSSTDPNNRPVIQVLPRPTQTVSPEPAGQATDDPGTLVGR